MIYTPKQLDLMRRWQNGDLSRINLLEGSVSSGKTWVSLVLWAFLVMESPKDANYMMCAKSLTTLKWNCLLLLEELVGKKHFSFSIAAKEGYLFGRHVRFEGANDARAESKIRGITLQAAYCDELTQFPEDFFTMLLSRLRLPNAKLVATTNPDAPGHWLKEKYIDRAEDLDLYAVKFMLDDNTTLPADYIANIKKEYVGVYYDRYIMGAWALAEGLIYPMYEKAITDDVPEGVAEQYVISLDYGTQNPLAAIMWAKYGEIWYAVKEYYYSGRVSNAPKTDEEYENEINTWIADYFAGVGIKRPRTIRVIVDPSAASFIALLRRKGEKYRVIKGKNDVANGIRETATVLQNGKIKIHSGLKNWKKEAQGYAWDESTTEDKPIKQDDHLMDAMRYFVKTMHISRVQEPYISIF